MNKKNKKTLIILSIFALFMFGFSFVLVPFYNILCNALGINGKTNTTAAKNTQIIDNARTIKIDFLATTESKLPWKFYPSMKTVIAHPGENKKLFYTAENNSDHDMTTQAISSITPGIASKYFKMIQCFCFKKQTLKAHQSIQMPVVFYIDSTLPKQIHEITLSYSLFLAK